MSRYRYFKPHTIRLVQAKYGRCLLCGKEAKGLTMIWLKDIGVVCPDHDSYALIYEYDDGYYSSQTIVKIHATREGAEGECKELNRRMVEARAVIGFRPASYVVRPLRELVNLREKVTELEEWEPEE
jgi:hypothetical protein